MTAQIKTTIGEVVDKLNKAIECHRKKMTHTWENGEKIKLGIFKSECVRLPLSAEDYWPVMMTFYPWSDLQGIFNAALAFPPDREMWISVELAGKLGIGARGLEK